MENQFSEIAGLIGEPVRAKIMWALLDGRAYTATELAVYTDTSAQNISMHLNKLLHADLLMVDKQGRHRYYTYSRPEISFAIEALANLIPRKLARSVIPGKIVPIEYCRTCYDHLAGTVGVMITDSLVEMGFISRANDSFRVSVDGENWFREIGIEVSSIKKQKGVFARACLDWSERRHHLAGSLGAALLDHMLSAHWIRRVANSREISITSKGKQELKTALGCPV